MTAHITPAEAQAHAAGECDEKRCPACKWEREVDQ